MSKFQRTRKYRESLGIKSEHELSRDQLAAQIKQFYVAHARADQFEPAWVHPAYDTTWMEMEEMRNFVEILKYTGRYRDPIFGDRYVEEGAKVGTTSWIFMGRKSCTPEIIDGWCVISREFRSKTYWMAYSMTEPIGMSAMTDDSIGPYESKEEVVRDIFQTSQEAIDAATLVAEKVSTIASKGVKHVQIHPDGSVTPGRLN